MSNASSLLNLGAHPPSSPRPFVKVGSFFRINFFNSLCTWRLVSIDSLTVFAPIDATKISWISGVPGPACAPPPSIFPNGNGNFKSDF